MMLLFLSSIQMIIFWSPSFLKGEKVNFDYLSQSREGPEKLKKGLKYGAGAGLLKKGVVVTFFLFNIFQSLSFLELEITLSLTKLYYVFEEKLFLLSP